MMKVEVSQILFAIDMWIQREGLCIYSFMNVVSVDDCMVTIHGFYESSVVLAHKLA
jgi:hypothetical protein